MKYKGGAAGSVRPATPLENPQRRRVFPVSSDTDFSNDLQHLYDLGEQLLGEMEASGGLLLPTDPTLYAQTGPKPKWPFSASWTFDQLWASL